MTRRIGEGFWANSFCLYNRRMVRRAPPVPSCRDRLSLDFFIHSFRLYDRRNGCWMKFAHFACPIGEIGEFFCEINSPPQSRQVLLLSCCFHSKVSVSPVAFKIFFFLLFFLEGYTEQRKKVKVWELLKNFSYYLVKFC